MPKVLIIEDDESIRSLYSRVFILEGFEVELAESGTIGLEKAQASIPDVIILDMMMPVVNGLEVLGKLKAIPAVSGIPVMILSNYSDQNISNRADTLGASLYLTKSDVEPSQVVAYARNLASKNGASNNATA